MSLSHGPRANAQCPRESHWQQGSPELRDAPRTVGRTHGLAIGRATRGMMVTAETTVGLGEPLSNEAAPQPLRCSGMRTRFSKQANVLLRWVNAAKGGFSRNVPIPSSLYDAFQRGIPRPPAEELFGSRRVGDEFGRVAGATLRFVNRDSASTRSLDRRNHLANGMTTSRAKVNCRVLLAPEHVPEGCNMRLGQVHNMGVVANCGVVRREVICPVYLESRFLSQRCLNGEWNKMSFR